MLSATTSSESLMASVERSNGSDARSAKSSNEHIRNALLFPVKPQRPSSCEEVPSTQPSVEWTSSSMKLFFITNAHRLKRKAAETVIFSFVPVSKDINKLFVVRASVVVAPCTKGRKLTLSCPKEVSASASHEASFCSFTAASSSPALPEADLRRARGSRHDPARAAAVCDKAAGFASASIDRNVEPLVAPRVDAAPLNMMQFPAIEREFRMEGTILQPERLSSASADHSVSLFPPLLESIQVDRSSRIEMTRSSECFW
mmetsp:Transcript_25752/g.43391  ORF Transcript_25752/g.43391 Transcript_25752/m.43391 type:complete len:259 (-) Transcript_25752:1295-2071(-)